MAGITQGQPEVAVGEPIRFGDIDGFELEQHPVSDRLIIRDTENGTVAYVRAERGGQIGGDGVLIKALKESKPMADTGLTYDTIQQAERQASSWVFVPPGTYDENVEITTQGLTLQGSGYNTLIDGGTSNSAIRLSEDNITVSNLSVSTEAGDNYPALNGRSSATNHDTDVENATIKNVTVRTSNHYGISLFRGDIINCSVENAGVNNTAATSVLLTDDGSIIGSIVTDSDAVDTDFDVGREGPSIISNCISLNANDNGMFVVSDSIVVGCRIINAGDMGITADGDNNIIANNRISDSTNQDISDDGTGTLLDGNLTGASN